MFALALGLPLLTLVWQSFFRNLAPPFFAPTGRSRSRTINSSCSYPIFIAAVKTSVSLAAMAATIVVALTFVMAWIAQRSAPRYGWVLDALAFTPIAIPSVIIGASVLFAYLMLPIPIYNTIWILLVAYVTMYLPYGMRFASGGIVQIHKELEEVAEVAGARLTRYSFASSCHCSRRCCWRPGFMFSCWRCANLARRFFSSDPEPMCSALSA